MQSSTLAQKVQTDQPSDGQLTDGQLTDGQLTDDQLTDGQLLVAALQDREAFGLFYDRHVREVLSFFARRVSDPEVAGDLTAETFAAALQGLKRFDPNKGVAVAWLFGIAHHQLSHWWRRAAVADRARRKLSMERRELDDVSFVSIENVIDAQAARVRLSGALDALSPRLRDAVRRRIVQGLSYEEIAILAGCSIPNARTRVSRGLTELARSCEGLR